MPINALSGVDKLALTLMLLLIFMLLNFRWIESLGPQLGKYLVLYLILAFHLPLEQLASQVQLQLVRPYACAIHRASTAIAGAGTSSRAYAQVLGGQGVQALGYAMAAGHSSLVVVK
jgi:hypothetical protein